MENHQIVSDTFQSTQIITGLSELKSCLQNFEIVTLRPKRVPKDPIVAKLKTKCFVVIRGSYSIHRFSLGK